MTREEAINKVRQMSPLSLLNLPKGTMEILKALAPELAESEDERMMKDIVAAVEMHGDLTQGRKSEIYAYLKLLKEQKWSPSEGEMGVLYKLCYISNQITDEDDTELTHLYQDLKREYFNGHSFENMFLNEKQKEPLTPEEKMNHPLYLEGFDVGRKVGQVEAEQKPAERIGEDEGQGLIDFAVAAVEDFYDKKNPIRVKIINFLKSIQLRPMWSEDDEQTIFMAIETLEYENYLTLAERLRSLRSRPKSSDNLPKWKKASAGTKLPSESVIRRDGEDPRFGSVAVYDCEYITVNELEKLTKED